MQPVAFLISRNLQKFGNITVCNIIHSLQILAKLIAIFHNHQFIPPHKPLFLKLHHRAHAHIVFYCTFVRTAENHSIILPITGICIAKAFDEFSASYPRNIVISRYRQPNILIFKHIPAILRTGYEFAEPRRVRKNPRLFLLPHDRRESTEHRSAHHRHILAGKRRTTVHPNRRELRGIAYEHKFTIDTAAHESHKVVKQVSAAKR